MTADFLLVLTARSQHFRRAAFRAGNRAGLQSICSSKGEYAGEARRANATAGLELEGAVKRVNLRRVITPWGSAGFEMLPIIFLSAVQKAPRRHAMGLPRLLRRKPRWKARTRAHGKCCSSSEAGKAAKAFYAYDFTERALEKVNAMVLLLAVLLRFLR